jgi:5-methylcytosine-specific restriction endonuclease McrA
MPNSTNYYKPLAELREEKGYLNYSDLLMTTEWKQFRDKIIRRDNSKCKKCGERNNELAWELKGSKPFDIFVRQADEFEKKFLGQDNIYSSVHIILNAHHKYYIKDKNPWEYNTDALITVCSICHSKIHETENILVYENESLKNPKIAQKCSKCFGTGYLDQYHYYMNGICFDCHGKGIIE